MRIRDIYQNRPFGLSFEIFPPKSEQGDRSLFEHLDQLIQHRPAFISCTYGAGGSTRNRTLDLCGLIQSRWQSTATAHFTCVGASREELEQWLSEAHQRGIQNIMALRGDPPQGQTEFKKAEGGLNYANELVELIRSTYPDIGIGVAGYPEKHLEACSYEVDLENLKRKVDAGADAIYTQLFFVNDHFFRFRDHCLAAGIEIPIVPGIMPITDFARIQRIISMCGTDFPAELVSGLEAAQDDADKMFDIGVEFATRQCEQLMEQKVPGIHFYVMNRSNAVNQILSQLPAMTSSAS